jgi:hypothetical protein
MSAQPGKERNVRSDARRVTHCDSKRFPKGHKPRGRLIPAAQRSYQSVFPR